MLSATSFIYDGIPSSQYGLKIASFEDDSIKEVAYLAPAITTVKTKKSNKFYYAGVSYDDLPTYSFTILRDNRDPQQCGLTINDQERREILGWLIGRKGFKDLVIDRTEGVNDGRIHYEYKCIFNNAEIIYHCGKCIGFNVTAVFDSPFCYYKRTTGTRHGLGDRDLKVVIDNYDTDLWDDYSYPTIKFTSKGFVNADKLITVQNYTDDPDGNRLFYFVGSPFDAGEVEVAVDNEKKIITGSGIELDSFSKNWLRLRRGNNTLKVRIEGDFEIIYTCYMKIGF